MEKFCRGETREEFFKSLDFDDLTRDFFEDFTLLQGKSLRETPYCSPLFLPKRRPTKISKKKKPPPTLYESLEWFFPEGLSNDLAWFTYNSSPYRDFFVSAYTLREKLSRLNLGYSHAHLEAYFLIMDQFFSEEGNVENTFLEQAISFYSQILRAEGESPCSAVTSSLCENLELHLLAFSGDSTPSLALDMRNIFSSKRPLLASKFYLPRNFSPPEGYSLVDYKKFQFAIRFLSCMPFVDEMSLEEEDAV